MEIKTISVIELEKSIASSKSKIPVLRDETKKLVWFGPTGEPKILDSGRLKAVNSEIEQLETKIEHNTNVLARLKAILKDTTVEKLDQDKTRVENRISGIPAELKHELYERVGKALHVESGSLICGESLLHQAGPDIVDKVLKDPEFMELQAKADAKVTELKNKVTGHTKTLEEARSIAVEAML